MGTKSVVLGGDLTLELVRVSDDPLSNGHHKYYCPFCRTYISGPVGKTLKHTCPVVGYAFIMNGFLWYGIQDYLEEEKQTVRRPSEGKDDQC